jgi:hypothetical protein
MSAIGELGAFLAREAAAVKSFGQRDPETDGVVTVLAQATNGRPAEV